MPAEHLAPEYWLHWHTLKVVWPMAIGSIVMAAPGALVCYVATLKVAGRYQEKLRQS
jgi:uncharacterized protein (DUF2062 family)